MIVTDPVFRSGSSGIILIIRGISRSGRVLFELRTMTFKVRFWKFCWYGRFLSAVINTSKGSALAIVSNVVSLVPRQPMSSTL